MERLASIQFILVFFRPSLRRRSAIFRTMSGSRSRLPILPAIVALGIVMLSCARNVLAFTSSVRIVARTSLSMTPLNMSTEFSSAEPSPKRQKVDETQKEKKEDVPLYLSEGIFAVNKPLEWSSNDVVSYIRGILERDARNRGAEVRKPRRRAKKGVVRVGHGGTLDPMASGVLVVGVGSGTKELQGFLSGSKRYTAGVKLGIETDTGDVAPEANITDTKPFDHVTMDAIEEVIPKFTGKIMQVPPIFSALKKDGKKLYEEARKGKTAEELGIEAREVTIYDLKLLPTNEKGEGLPSFGLDVECGGGTYIRSLVRDIGRELNTCATMTSLVRTQQAQFLLDNTVEKDDLSADTIFAAIDKTNSEMKSKGEDSKPDGDA